MRRVLGRELSMKARTPNEIATDTLHTKQMAAGVCKCCHSLQAVDSEHLCLYCSTMGCAVMNDNGNPHLRDHDWVCACGANCGHDSELFMRCMADHALGSGCRVSYHIGTEEGLSETWTTEKLLQEYSSCPWCTKRYNQEDWLQEASKLLAAINSLKET